MLPLVVRKTGKVTRLAGIKPSSILTPTTRAQRKGEGNGKMTEIPSRRRSSGREACTVSMGTWVALLVVVVITGTLGPRREERRVKPEGGKEGLEMGPFCTLDV